MADPSIGWRVLLTATVVRPPDVDAVAEALRDLGAGQGWPSPPLRTADSTATLRERLVHPDPAPLVVGIAGSDLVLSAHHAAVDGLGMLAVLEHLSLGPVTSSARGVGDRHEAHGYVGTVARRLAEAVVRPPARLRPDRVPIPAVGDVMVETEVPGRISTAVLVHAAAHAVADRGAGRRVAVAVGATRERPADGALDDRSVLIRLRDVERLDVAGIERALREAPVERPPVTARSRPWTAAVDRASAVGMRVLARRLGSTLLVSHLGEVTAPRLERIAFHPVTAGGTGISLGAAGHAGRTVLTLRARGTDWDGDGLERLLEAVAGRLW